jgi:two-component system cell cycle sensor histidine kinase/response regulator CckA
MTSRQILVVDDEPQLVQLVTRYLERLNYNAVYARTTKDAWEMIARDAGAFGLVVIDVTMMDPGGEELARRILESRPGTRVIVSSGYPVDVTAIERDFSGRVGFLQKPYTGEMLAEAVQRLLH